VTKNISMADTLLDKVYKKLGLTNDKEKLSSIYEIIDELNKIHIIDGINGTTTGKITERLVEVQLRIFAEDTYFNIKVNSDKWVGDFGLIGIPFNTIISVKSYTAKERLITSGSGSALCPTIGYGHFKDIKGFSSIDRLLSYKIRGFISIYIPKSTYSLLEKKLKDFKNINDKPFIRQIQNFGEDLSNAMEVRVIGKESQKIINPRKL